MAKLIVILVLVLALAVLLLHAPVERFFFLMEQRRLAAKAGMIQKLDSGQVVLPSGASAYDMWMEIAKKDPKDKNLTEISAQALPLLSNRGEQIFQRLHDDGQTSQQ